VNSARIIKGKRLIILLKAWEGKAEVHENFAYCVAQLDTLEQPADAEQKENPRLVSGTVKGDIIGYNARLGSFETKI
jgi:hypothetical protein